MNNKKDPHGRYAFGRWSFDADAGDLYGGEASVRLEPRIARLLEYFLHHQHKVISRNELLATVWENRIVSDDAINRCVSKLRHVLTPDDKNAYIETVVRKGYITHFPPPPATEATKVQQPYGRHRYLLLTALACVAAILLYAATNFDYPDLEPRDTKRSVPPMIAVLPFSTSSHTGDSEFFANGMFDDLLTQLAKMQSMRVISATSTKEYRNVARNVRNIGKELGADVILEGSVQIVANRIHINAQLIDARTDEHLWAESYDRELAVSNIFDVQSGIARAIAMELRAALTDEDKKQLALIPTGNMAAYRAYHRAMQLRDASGYNVSSPEYLEALEEAVLLDPTFSRAWAELVSTLAYLNFSGDKPEMTLRAEQALQSLQAVAPGSAEHLMGQAAYVYYALRDYDRAHDIISLALTKSPSDMNALQLRSWIERRQGNFDAYLDTRYEARHLDPRNPARTDDVFRALHITHRYEQAWEENQKSSRESFESGYAKNLHRFWKNRDFRQWQESMVVLCGFYVTEPACEWEAHIANRDYLQALESLRQTDHLVDAPGISEFGRRRILTYWLMQEKTLLAQGLPEWQSQLESDRDNSGGLRRSHSYIGSAMLAGIQGRDAEAEQFIELWNRFTPVDFAERAARGHEACRVLGMIGATRAAVQCIVEGLEEASNIVPFMEPYFPFYDSIRDTPEFTQMVADIDAAQ